MPYPVTNVIQRAMGSKPLRQSQRIQILPFGYGKSLTDHQAKGLMASSSQNVKFEQPEVTLWETEIN